MAIQVLDKDGNAVTLNTSDVAGVHTPHNHIDSLPSTLVADVATLREGPTTIVHGVKTVTTAGTAEALGVSTTLYSDLRIRALTTNTGNAYVGGSTVTAATGFPLGSGEEVTVRISDLSSIYIDVDTDGEGVAYIGG